MSSARLVQRATGFIPVGGAVPSGLTRRLAGVMVCWLICVSTVHADLGTLRVKQEEITVFTSPAPLRAGTVEVKVLLQGSDRPVGAMRVWVRARQGSQMIEVAAVPGTPFFVANLDLPQAGDWQFEVEVEGTAKPIVFQAEVASPIPTWQALLPWLAWPLLPIALFVLHQRLVRRSG